MQSPTFPSEFAAEEPGVVREGVPQLEARELLRRYGLLAKKSWGQNFLVDERTYRAIVEACVLEAGDTAVEIGAGLGTLTSRLLQTGAKVVAIERERDMCSVLEAELGGVSRFTLRAENALRVDYAELARELGGRVVVVGNLPYQISSPLLFRFLEARAVVSRIVIMVQREVADRIVAEAGSDDYSALSAQVQRVARVRRVCQVGRGAFLPAPRVDSTVVLLQPYGEPLVAVREEARYGQVVRAAFGQRRKTLRNALGAVFGEAAEEALRGAGLDPVRRGETLTVAEFAQLANALSEVLSQRAGTERALIEPAEPND